ncbi:transcription initiation factor IIB [Haloarchaeobius amylolyticus]|uniref:transcription initiation factor IIB n=1 Tax=Haloarchaeobius amylolyticus TaxID=1198296 RepID=UPI00226D6B4F|nr:TFIIB-type zinc ribbon-containing protein [Haloarchaeobius amylolyticus]
MTRKDSIGSDVPSGRENAPLQCPECGGSVRNDETHGETVCMDCGLVVAEDEIDRGPEWQAFSSDEADQRSRVGAPVSVLWHDKGLSTTIDWKNADSSGAPLSHNQRRQMERLRVWNQRFTMENSKKRNLRQALGEIDRMASALGLPTDVRETASVIYRRALKEDLLPGRSIESIATASLYIAARQVGIPRTIDEVIEVSRIQDSDFRRAYRTLVRELNLVVQLADPKDYVRRYASSLGLSSEGERIAYQLLENAQQKGIDSGKSPVTLAAAAVYAASVVTAEDITQRDVSEVANMSTVTIRTRYKELLNATPEYSSFTQ